MDFKQFEHWREVSINDLCNVNGASQSQIENNDASQVREKRGASTALYVAVVSDTFLS